MDFYGKTGVLIDGEVFFCKEGEHNSLITKILEERELDDFDKYIDDKVVFFHEKYLYNSTYDLSKTSEKNLKVILKTKYREYFDYLMGDD